MSAMNFHHLSPSCPFSSLLLAENVRPKKSLLLLCVLLVWDPLSIISVASRCMSGKSLAGARADFPVATSLRKETPLSEAMLNILSTMKGWQGPRQSCAGSCNCSKFKIAMAVLCVEMCFYCTPPLLQI